MCTVCVWSEANNGVATLSSRNMDWYEPMDTYVWVLPAGIERTSMPAGTVGAFNWTSKYGSVVSSVYDIATADGMNEKGLAAHILWLAESSYGVRNTSEPALSLSLWAQYYLDNFATVAEAIAEFDNCHYQLRPAEIGTGDRAREATVHLQISDATGDVAVLEVIDGEVQIHVGPEYPVLTNSPTFAAQLANMKRYEGFGGSDPLPGTTQAADRFVRAAYYLRSLEKPKSLEPAIAGLLSVLRNTAQPWGVPTPGQPNISPTIWRTTADHSNLVYYFESTSSPYLIWLNLNKLDFSPGAPVLKLDPNNLVDKVGEASASLTEAEPFTFLLSQD